MSTDVNVRYKFNGEMGEGGTKGKSDLIFEVRGDADAWECQRFADIRDAF